MFSNDNIIAGAPAALILTCGWSISISAMLIPALSTSSVEQINARKRQQRYIFNVLNGPGPTMFCPDWLDLDHNVTPPALLKDPAQEFKAFLMTYGWHRGAFRSKGMSAGGSNS